MDSKETAVITLRVPIAWKRALGQVAAAQDTTMTELLRAQVEKIITTYRDGIFFDLNVRKNGQVRSSESDEAHQ